MLYTSLSLNGTWEMDYREDKYISDKSPFSGIHKFVDAAGTEPEDITNNLIRDAVPGYWEDMVEKFQYTSFFSKLKVHPGYGVQNYPIVGRAPDMALPNITGTFFYRRKFDFNGNGKYTEIYFGGVQNSVSVWVNDVYIGTHEGYSTPFAMKIPDGILKNGENEISLSVSNEILKGIYEYPISGLTSRAVNENTGGITGNVEIRVYNSPIKHASVLISKDLKTANVHLDGACDLEWEIWDNKNAVKCGKAYGDFSFDTEGLTCWSPENPKLYTLKIKCADAEEVISFGVRSFVADGIKFRLNNIPYYLRGVCEHCYYPQTVHPSCDITYYRNVIKKLKSLGFNFIRFHTYVPAEEYMQAADELGMLVQVECPNNSTVSQWEEIVGFCKKHPSVVIYCCGNELLVDEPFIEYLNECADYVHKNTDALFSPMSALRGIEYFWDEPGIDEKTASVPLKHHPERLGKLSRFSDLYSSYTNGQHSYFSFDSDPETVDSWNNAYNKPRVSHEICIDGTYTDLSLKDRYKGLRIGETKMFSSLEKHLESKGLLKNAPLYFQNSSQWQRRVRKFCFEKMRKCRNMAGYDFLGPIDTHWHTFGYDVGMMNEFYELKPGETVRNVLMYNSPTVILNSLDKKVNFASGEVLCAGISVSHFGEADLTNAEFNVRLSSDGKVIERKKVYVENIKNGDVSEVFTFKCVLPEVKTPEKMKLYITLDCGNTFCENEWELYLFPSAEVSETAVAVSRGMDIDELISRMEKGENVLLLGAKPFVSLPTTFRIALAGRASGNLATVVNDHPALKNLPHDGFCSWQFAKMMENGSAVCFETDSVPFDPIIEVVSSHKYAIRQAALFEFNAEKGKLLVCSYDFKKDDPCADWLLSQLIGYMESDEFVPKNSINKKQLYDLANCKIVKPMENKNLAFNANDTAIGGRN